MIVTEEEAKTKWCPNAPPIPVDASGNIRPHDATCIGSACMAWRWDGETEYENGEALPFGMAPADPGWEMDGETWYAGPGVTGEKRQRWRRPLPRKGYCGKAGRP